MRTLLSLFLALAVITPALAQNSPYAPFRQEPFTDVSESNPFYEAIDSLRERNILQGYPEGDFRPEARINRAEFVFLITNPLLMDTMALNVCLTSEDVKDSQTIYFPDVDRGAWYAPAVCHAKRKGLINGYPNGKYMPGEYINFVEAAKIISSAMALQTKEEPGEQWFQPYVQALSDEHAIPVSIKTFNQMLTRGEMAEMLYRMHNDITDRSHRVMSEMTY